jgi:hypothetical protein
MREATTPPCTGIQLERLHGHPLSEQHEKVEEGRKMALANISWWDWGA